MTIAKFLDLHTQYMHLSDKELLEDRVRPSVIVEHDHGWWVHVPLDDTYAGIMQDYRNNGFSEDFIKVIDYARANDCWWVNFDEDGEEEEVLPYFEWDDEIAARRDDIDEATKKANASRAED